MRKKIILSVSIAIAIIVLLPPLLLAWIYGEPEPCRALAVERARLASATGTGPVNVLEPWQRLATSQLSAAQCMGGLLDSWGERLAQRMPK